MVSLLKFQLEVPGAPGRAKALENEDLLPVPSEKRTWNFTVYTVFWFSAVGTVANWNGIGSTLTYGLTVWDALLCNFFGYIIVGILMVINGRAGAVYHVGFPVVCRSSFGVYGAWWPVLNRSLSACVWNGVNTVTGGQCIYVLLHAIFPSIARVPNHMPASSGLTSIQMVCFFLFWLATGSALFLSIPRWKILIHAKLVAYVVASVAMLALALHNAGGVGTTLTEKPTVHGAARAWLICRFFFLATAGCATFVSNAADWQRNAAKPSDPVLGQVLGFPLSNFITSLFGAIVAASSKKVYGTLVWNPITYLDMILSDNYTPAIRAGAFFIALGFTYAALFSCVFENVLPAGNDIASLAPKYISVKRGFAICMIVTVVINPWYLLGSAGIFITFISSYQIFLFSIAGILMVDYYLVARGRMNLDKLYTADPSGPYYYKFGVNWRAIVAYIVGAAINFTGFLYNMKAVTVGTSVLRSYYFAYITSACGAGLTYYLLARFVPQASYLAAEGQGFREWTQDEVEVFAGGKRVIEDAPAEQGEHAEPVDVDDKYSGEEVKIVAAT
ncbi:hypothetical protein Q5752_002811 [Cryptotrichosporon argae]